MKHNTPEINEFGKRYGKLLVIRKSHMSGRHGAAMWECRCDCGDGIPAIRGTTLRRGLVLECLACRAGRSLAEQGRDA